MEPLDHGSAAVALWLRGYAPELEEATREALATPRSRDRARTRPNDAGSAR